ncbi:MAG: hypothetical protein LUQ07_00885 [Methanospirillum sp.]|nr:hypothetical protein [Methanospirillum sp.]
MKIWYLVFLAGILLISGCVVAGQNESVGGNISQNVTETPSSVNISAEERLMKLAFDARAFALEKGKETALAEFNKPSGSYSKEGLHIIAYDQNGVLLADAKRTGSVGSAGISQEHDTGLISQMRDFVSNGGGLFTDTAANESYYLLDIDENWWIISARDSSVIQ